MVRKESKETKLIKDLTILHIREITDPVTMGKILEFVSEIIKETS